MRHGGLARVVGWVLPLPGCCRVFIVVVFSVVVRRSVACVLARDSSRSVSCPALAPLVVAPCCIWLHTLHTQLQHATAICGRAPLASRLQCLGWHRLMHRRELSPLAQMAGCDRDSNVAPGAGRLGQAHRQSSQGVWGAGSNFVQPRVAAAAPALRRQTSGRDWAGERDGSMAGATAQRLNGSTARPFWTRNTTTMPPGPSAAEGARTVSPPAGLQMAVQNKWPHTNRPAQP